MNVVEKRLAERNMRHNEMMQSDPIYASLYQHAQKRANDERRRSEILDSYGPNGFISPKQDKPRQLTDEELQIQEVLKNY